jgi:hypothetical protein
MSLATLGWPAARTLLLLGVAARVGVALAAGDLFPPVADGTYFHLHAVRLAEGLGYSVADGDSVRPVAHYPIGYPAALSFAYRLLGAHPSSGSWLAAGVGALAAWALFRATRGSDERARARLMTCFALSPALLVYTPALMTEGVTAGLYALVCAGALFCADPRGRVVAAGALVLGGSAGLAVLVRPQSIVWFAVVLALVVVFQRSRRRAWGVAAASATIAATLVGPWTARNCAVMDRCVLVSANDGWNLLIGTNPAADGTWAEVVVPPECEGLSTEGAVNACFGRSAREEIARRPLDWLALAPRKLGRTFDYAGAGPWYLHASNPSAFPFEAKVAAGVVETVATRVTLLIALLGVLRASWPSMRPSWRAALAVGLAASPFGAPGHLLFGALAVRLGWSRGEPLNRRLSWALAGSLVLVTALIHVLFFGAGRYALVLVPALALGAALAQAPSTSNPEAKEERKRREMRGF